MWNRSNCWRNLIYILHCRTLYYLIHRINHAVPLLVVLACTLKRPERVRNKHVDYEMDIWLPEWPCLYEVNMSFTEWFPEWLFSLWSKYEDYKMEVWFPKWQCAIQGTIRLFRNPHVYFVKFNWFCLSVVLVVVSFVCFLLVSLLPLIQISTNLHQLVNYCRFVVFIFTILIVFPLS